MHEGSVYFSAMTAEAMQTLQDWRAKTTCLGRGHPELV